MKKENKFPNTLHQAIKYFAQGDRAFEYMKKVRWHDGKVSCPRCGSDEVSFVSTRKLWTCKHCTTKKQFTIRVGTILEDSAIPFDKWICAFWLIANAKNGISSYELHRSIGVTQKTAWFMLQRIRLAMQNGSILKMEGQVEVDETFIDAETYVEGHVHTNGLENLWCHLKRLIKGTYVNIEPFHLFRYIDEHAFRFNEHKDTYRVSFKKAISAIIGKELTCAQLTGKAAPSALLPA